MIRLALICALFVPLPVLAQSFDRPIPQAQSATAEFWFTFASIALIAALIAVGRLVAKR